MIVIRSLAFRLLAGIFAIMVAGIALQTYILIDLQANRYTEYSIGVATRTSDVIKRSTDYSMLLNRREDIYHTIKTIGSEPGIEGIRIYNKKGEISFSSHDAEIGKSVDMNAEACVACHKEGSISAITPQKSTLVRFFSSPNGYRMIGLITPIKNEERCSRSECHVHPTSQSVLGVLDVMIPLAEVDKNIADFQQFQYLGGIGFLLIVTLFTGLFIWRVVTRPVHQLIRGTQEIIKGNLTHRIHSTNDDEIGILTRSFNHMSVELQQTHEELTRFNQTLEKRVQEKTEELRRTQSHLIQIEKMASLGTLAATVAHELNNPLEGILTYAKLIKRKVDRTGLEEGQKKELGEELTMIAHESARCGTIVKNLLLFSRRRVGALREHNINDILLQTLKLMDHHFKMNNIEVALDCAPTLPMLFCDGEQLEQALLALEINAVEAMPTGGTLSMSVQQKGEVFLLTVSDTGYGIREEDLPHIFEPFFTTKKEGKGTGLGLAVVYGIIQRHGGTITVHSDLTKGTQFIITLPLQPKTMLEEAI